MKVHTNLEELLREMINEIEHTTELDLSNWEKGQTIEGFLSRNSLASAEQRPLAKNKQTENNLLCAVEEYSNGKAKCDVQCQACKNYEEEII